MLFYLVPFVAALRGFGDSELAKYIFNMSIQNEFSEDTEILSQAQNNALNVVDMMENRLERMKIDSAGENKTTLNESEELKRQFYLLFESFCSLVRSRFENGVVKRVGHMTFKDNSIELFKIFEEKKTECYEKLLLWFDEEFLAVIDEYSHCGDSDSSE